MKDWFIKLEFTFFDEDEFLGYIVGNVDHSEHEELIDILLKRFI